MYTVCTWLSLQKELCCIPPTVLQLELPGTVSQKDLSALFFHTVYLGDRAKYWIGKLTIKRLVLKVSRCLKWTPVVDYEVIREMLLYVYIRRHGWKHGVRKCSHDEPEDCTFDPKARRKRTRRVEVSLEHACSFFSILPSFIFEDWHFENCFWIWTSQSQAHSVLV